MTKDKGCRPVEKARDQVEQLLADFLANPGGEAAQIARTLLLDCMVKEQTQQEEEALRELQEERGTRVVLEEDVGTLAVGRLNADTLNLRLADELREARGRHDKIGGYVAHVRKALAEQKSFDYDRALNQISALVGLRGGEEFLHDELQTEAKQ
jgi:hypothetical protein